MIRYSLTHPTEETREKTGNSIEASVALIKSMVRPYDNRAKVYSSSVSEISIESENKLPEELVRRMSSVCEVRAKD